MARSLNKAQLIGNLTRDPELRYTPQGSAVCTFGIATNRSWTTDGEKKEDTEFHRIVAWNKLAELCSQLLSKGRKVYVEGRISSRSWTGQDGAQRNTTEIVIEDMVILDSRRTVENTEQEEPIQAHPEENLQDNITEENKSEIKKDSSVKSSEQKEEKPSEDINPDDIPF